jgi:prepilin-type N-terminal cleavage/methylation domain-containing protein
MGVEGKYGGEWQPSDPQHNINCEEIMIKREEGFTLIELLITMVIFILVIAAGSQIFTGLLTQFKQQSKVQNKYQGL